MNIIQITPGAGGMYCGNCFRDNALVSALRKLGHSTLMVPLYLPMTLDEEDQSADTPIFFSGISVYLEQKSAWFRTMPDWLHRWLASPALLKWAAGRAAKTRAEDVGDLTLSMLRGEEGNQARELDSLIEWLKTQAGPDVVCLSNALLIGMVRKIKQELRVPVICMLQGEDSFLEALPNPQRDAAWRTLAQRAAEVDLFVAPSRYFGELMRQRLGLPAERLRFVYNGINLDPYTPSSAPESKPVIGYFARMCREKGLELLIDAFLVLKRRKRAPEARLRVGGGLGPSDRAFVNELRRRLVSAGCAQDVEFCPNLDRAAKIEFLRGLTLFSTPAIYSEAFGLYVIEAMAAGVPVVQPRHAAFPEIVELTGGGLLCAPEDPEALAAAWEQLLLDPARARALGEAGARSIRESFSVEMMAAKMLEVFEQALARKQPPQVADVGDA